jgi:hypothetical protein
MKSKIQNLLRVILLMFIAINFQGCKKENTTTKKGDPSDLSVNDYKLSLYKAPSTINADQVILQGEVKDKSTGSEIFYFGTYKKVNGKMVPDKLKSTLTRNSTKDTSIVQLFDDNGGVFIYKVNNQTNTKDNILSEFEKIDDQSFYYRVWDYDWTNKKGECLYTSLVKKDSDSLQASKIYFNENKPAQGLALNERLDRFVSKYKNDDFDPSFAHIELFNTNRKVRSTDDEDLEYFQSEIHSSFKNSGNAITQAITKELPKLGFKVLIVGLLVESTPLIIAGTAAVMVSKTGGVIVTNMINGFINKTLPDNTDITYTTDQNLDDNNRDLTDIYEEAGIDTENNDLSTVSPYNCSISLNRICGPSGCTIYTIGGTPPYNWTVYKNGVYVSGGNWFSVNTSSGDYLDITAVDSKDCNATQRFNY